MKVKRDKNQEIVAFQRLPDKMVLEVKRWILTRSRVHSFLAKVRIFEIMMTKAAIRTTTVVLCILLCPSGAEAQAEGGYGDSFCVSQGDTFRFHISTSITDFALKLYKLGNQKILVATFDHVQGGTSMLPDSSYWYGCKWPVSYSLKIPNAWTPGVYVAEFPITNGNGQIVFCVKALILGTYSNVCLKMSVNTWEAYNNFGGKSLYGFNSTGGKASAKVSFNRPNDMSSYFIWENKMVSWLDSQGIPVEFTTNIELYKNPNELNNYRVLIFVGHDEYWSHGERTQLEQFMARGGNIMILSGNTCWWQVRFEDDARTMVCYKDRNLDPLNGKVDSLVTVNWYAPPVNEPENMLTGVSWRNGGYVNSGNMLPFVLGYGDYTIYNSQHWVYKETQLLDGQSFGHSGPIVGYETDGALYTWINGIPTVTGADKTPMNFKILAISPAMFNAAINHATSGIYFMPGGGTVFNAATTGWVYGLAYDATVQKVTKNIIGRFLSNKFPPDIDAWSPFRIRSDSIHHEIAYINKRSITIPAGKSENFSVTASDPRNAQLGFYWTLNNLLVSNTSNYLYFSPSVQPSGKVDTITAYVYNQNDTTSIQWSVKNSPVSLAFPAPSVQLEAGSPFYQKVDVSDYYGDILTYQIVTGPTWFKVNQDGLVWGTPVDTGLYLASVRVSDLHSNADTATITMRVNNFSIVDNFEYGDSPLNHGWQVATPLVKATISTVYDSVLKSRVMEVISSSGQNFRIDRPVYLSRTHFSTRIFATLPFEFFVRCIDAVGKVFYVQYNPDGGPSTFDGTYAIFHIGSKFQSGQWNLLERDVKGDLQTVGYGGDIHVVGFLIRGSFRLDDLFTYAAPYPSDSDNTRENKPAIFSLWTNFPNPFNPSTKIKFALPSASSVRLEIYDILGRLVKTLISNKQLTVGEHVVTWSGDDNHGKNVSSGIYFDRLIAMPLSGEPGKTLALKMILIR